ncbi:DUF751 family protein [Iningainema tapete]|uniref:DUF751 family protein n=1 Tax=Iningainema tapete BLCC-T55 TaxID=2748662 RepID=A0A8J6XNZ6_9CYAN|nr:DUF751 family protein [Iningainema tapete]MBD2773962.1 DUF751 family protein [Iningainema tapete BLCC-T55]
MFEGFWINVLRYIRYFVTTLLGVLLSVVESLRQLFQRPVTAIALLGLIVGGFVFLTLTLRAMLGLSTI